jgi:O-antigen/teichoic acid export membrane protein
MTAITGVVLLVAGDAILDLFGAGALHKYLWLLLLGQFAAAVYAIFTSLGTRTRDFTGLAGARVNQNVVMLALQLALSATGAAGLLIGDAAGRYAAGLRMAHRGFRSYRRSYMTTSWQRMIVATRRYRSFAVIGVWPALVSAITVYAPVLLIAAFYGPHVGGLFSLGQRLIAAPNALLVLSIGQVFMGETARRMHADPMTIAPLYRSTLTRLMKLSVPLLIVSIPASFLVGPLFGSEWKAAGTYIAILAPMYALQIVSSPFGGILDVLERQDLFLLREVIRLVLLASAVSLASALSLPAVGAVIALSAAGCLSYVAYSLISWYALRVHQRTWTAGAGPGASPSAVPAD